MANVPTHRPVLVPRIVLGLSLAAVVALIVWTLSHLKNDHWQEVARARSYLDRGQPDLALQVIAGIRDNRPGAPEGLTVASRAFLMRGDIARARRGLERSLKLKHDQPDAAKMLAAIYLAAGDDHRGVELLEEAARWETWQRGRAARDPRAARSRAIKESRLARL